ncbi:MAG: response regulator [Selenomonas sp.]|nr:response regulator [Selenomonas sp.]
MAMEWESMAALPLPIFIYSYEEGEGGKCLKVSKGLCDFLKLEEEAACRYLSQSLDLVTHPEDTQRIRQATQRALDNGEEQWRLSFRMLRPDGTYVWIICHTVQVNLPEGGRLFYGSLMDVANEHEQNERRRAEQKHMNLLLDKILETTQIGIFWKDKERRFLGANKAFLEYYGFPSESVIIGKTDEDMGWHEEDGPYKNDELWVLETGHSTHRVRGKCLSHGEMRDIVASKSPLIENGEIVGLVGSFEDVTEEYRQQQKIVELNDRLLASLKRTEMANRAKTAFLSNVSHDMRTPLNGILGFARLAAASNNMEKVQNYLQKILKSAELLQSLIDDTLELSRISAGKLRLEPEIVEAENMFDALLTTISSMAENKGLHFETKGSLAEMGTVKVDALKLNKVFLNLLSNAVKFTHVGGTVTFAAECLPERQGGRRKCRVSIKDTGIGMEDSFLPKMFEPFVQEHRLPVQGTGLGLAIAKQLVDMLGGSINVSSRVGEGTEFRVEFYMEQMMAPVPGRGNEAIPKDFFEGRRVLLCEDNALNQELAKTLLEDEGMAVILAENGQIGIEIFNDSDLGSIDAILMDIRMPVMDGLQAAKLIRAMPRKDSRAVPILALTANAFREDAEKSKAAGMNSHLTKPLEPEKLLHDLAHYMEAYDEARTGWPELDKS